jgi:manganese transport protein
MAGQVIMQGFLRRRIPVWLRRVVTMVPGFIVVALGADVTHCLVLSQVVLSLVLPVPMVALLLLSRRRAVMGSFAMGAGVGLLACGAAVVTLGLDGVLVAQFLGGG